MVLRIMGNFHGNCIKIKFSFPENSFDGEIQKTLLTF
jgi:hypothetical protein